MFEAHGIPAIVGGQNHANLFAGLGGFVSLDIWVDEDDAEEASALLRDVREPDTSAGDQLAGDYDDDDDELDRDDDDDGDASDPAYVTARTHVRAISLHRTPDRSVHQRVERRRRIGIVLLLSCLVTFGTGHMFTRAWLRGISLAAIQSYGIGRAVMGHPLGGLAVAAAIVADLTGALLRVRKTLAPVLPMARARHTA